MACPLIKGQRPKDFSYRKRKKGARFRYWVPTNTLLRSEDLPFTVLGPDEFKGWKTFKLKATRMLTEVTGISVGTYAVRNIND